MNFDPFYPDPKNVLLQYIIDTSDIEVSENVAEALTNISPIETAEFCRLAKETPQRIPWGSGHRTVMWSEKRQMLILRPLND